MFKIDSRQPNKTLKLSTFKPKQLNQFQSEDDNSVGTPISAGSTKKGGYQTDDSDAGTPVDIQKKPSLNQQQSFKSSKFKQQSIADRHNKPHLTQTGRSIVESQLMPKHVQSDAEMKKYNAQSERNDHLKQHAYRHLIFSQKVDPQLFVKHLTLTQRGLVYATKCLKGPSDNFIKQKQIEVPLEETKQKFLFLDLDETLIHSCQGKEQSQVSIKINEDSKIGINVRPYLGYFLDCMSQHYSIFVFTASSANYATAIIDYIDPEQNKILGIFTRTHCMETKNGFFIKDLRILKGVNLKDMIIVDNLSHSFGLQIDNGVPILEWTNDPNDQELRHLADYLIEASRHDDLREFNKQRLKLRELVDFEISEL